MRNLNLEWSGRRLLGRELAMPVVKASMRTVAHGRPISVTLWRTDGSGLQIQSVMHDIADRLEVGVLAFRSVDSPLPDERMVDLPPAFVGQISVSKLTITESGVCAESGLTLEASDGSQVVVIAGVNPYTLAVRGVVDQPHVFEPEYPLANYIAVPLV